MSHRRDHSAIASLIQFTLDSHVGWARRIDGWWIDTTKFQGFESIEALIVAHFLTRLNSGTLSYDNIAHSGPTWVLDSPEITVTTSVLSSRRSIMFDSGTSNILFSTATTEVIEQVSFR